ncbi:MAG TPA: N-acetylglucosamine-6-phosphate deacetylase [Candidatus Latescibacteria bacterium]|nr:N-acetylglucosamine-6-phosphate deacetylase [Candidatus Latescibacterota bacterium]
MLVLRGTVVAPDGVHPGWEVRIEGERISEVGPPSGQTSEEVLDFGEAWVMPGFIDLHTHGLGPHDPKSREGIVGMAEWKVRFGTTGFLPSLASATEEEYLRFLDDVRSVQDDPPEKGARVLGGHMEGPFVNPKTKGGMDERFLRLPDPEEYRKYLVPQLKLMTLAPELPGALELIRALRDNGTVASAGHSDAGLEDMERAVEAGLSHVCHLFNAFPERPEREKGVKQPSLLEICLATEGLTAEVNGDGIHVHPLMIRLAVRAMGVENVVLITDSMEGTGLPEGVYRMTDGRRYRTRKGDVARLVDSPDIIVGSVLTMERGVKNLAELCGFSLHVASRMASLNPARVLGMEKEIGSIEPGKLADIAVLDHEYRVVMTLVGGEIACRGD